SMCYYVHATLVLYSLSLHDALPIWSREQHVLGGAATCSGGVEHERELVAHHLLAHELLQPTRAQRGLRGALGRHRLGARHGVRRDRKSTRLNSSHVSISYAVFCLKK